MRSSLSPVSISSPTTPSSLVQLSRDCDLESLPPGQQTPLHSDIVDEFMHDAQVDSSVESVVETAQEPKHAVPEEPKHAVPELAESQPAQLIKSQHPLVEMENDTLAEHYEKQLGGKLSEGMEDEVAKHFTNIAPQLGSLAKDQGQLDPSELSPADLKEYNRLKEGLQQDVINPRTYLGTEFREHVKAMSPDELSKYTVLNKVDKDAFKKQWTQGRFDLFVSQRTQHIANIMHSVLFL